jgi:hypothetical protein
LVASYQRSSKIDPPESIALAASEESAAEIVGFDLAAHILHAIVASVDFMTFQTRNMRDAAEKLAGAALSGAVDSIRLCGIDRVSLLLPRLVAQKVWAVVDSKGSYVDKAGQIPLVKAASSCGHSDA